MPGVVRPVSAVRLRALLPIAIALTLAAPPSSSLAAGGIPDPGFGAGGVASVSTAVPGAREFGNAMVVDSQDRVIVGGGALAKEPTEPNGGWVLARFRGDGTLDPTFGQGGVAKVAPGLFGPGLAEFGQEIRALAIEPGTGKIIAGGMTVNPSHFGLFTVARYNTNGSLDTSFGPANTGFVTAEFPPSSAELEDIAVGADGSITAVGSSGFDVALARWDSEGNLDPSFDGPAGNGNGTFTDLITGTFDDLRDVAVEPTGAVRAVGVVSTASVAEWLIVRYTPTGAREMTFNGSGAVTKGLGNGSDLGGGQVLVGNVLYVFGSIDIVPGSETERDFGVDAFNATTGAELPGTITRVHLPESQNLLGAGLQRIGGSADPSAQRFLLVGTGAGLAGMRRAGAGPALELDPEFGNGGIVAPPQELGNWEDVASDSHNRVVVGGDLGLFETADLSAARYVDVTPPAPDTTAPVITNARVSPHAWAVRAGGPAEVPVASRVRRGTSFLYTLSEPARVTIQIGRRVQGKRRPRKFKRVGAFAAAGSAGPNLRRFSGRIGRRRLKPGRYRATLIATDSAGNVSLPTQVSFRVLRPRAEGAAGSGKRARP